MDIRKGKIYALIFVIFILFLALGGFFLTNYLTKETKKDNNKTNSELIEEVTLKKNKKEEFIYFENADIKSETLNIIFKKVNINIDSKEASNIEQNLNEESINLEKSLKRISEIETLADEEIIYKDDDIYSVDYLNYTRYFYKEYASLLVDKYTFDCYKGSNYLNSKAYTFNTNTGKILTNEEILANYKTNMNKIKMQVQDKLTKKEDEDIDIASTLDNLDNSDNFALYINKSGYLTLSYLVKSAKNDYNDVIIFN